MKKTLKADVIIQDLIMHERLSGYWACRKYKEKTVENQYKMEDMQHHNNRKATELESILQRYFDYSANEIGKITDGVFQEGWDMAEKLYEMEDR